jgi:uncharacterized membrane protein YesL
MVIVTIVWFLAQITIVLGPPATFGYYYVAYNLLNGESLGIRGLIEGARKYFWKAWLWGLINLLVIITLVVNIQFYSNIRASWGLSLVILVGLLGLVWFCTQFYALPFFMEQEDKRLRVALKNGLFTTLAAPLFTLILFIVAVILMVLSFAIVLPIFLGIPGLVTVMAFRGVYDRLIAFKIRKPEKTPKEIEAEQAGRIHVPEFDHSDREDKENGPL